MKNYNKILEAVNRGIKFALDDFDDQEELRGQVNSKVKYKGGTKEWLDLMNDVVDLGLPSGTLWCKYNLGVDSNLLTNPEDWYGDYYAWGELEGNKTNKNGDIYFDWDNYKFGNEYNLTKYCNRLGYGLNNFTDNLTELQPVDDVAYLTKKLHNFKFHIPTKELFEELLKYTNNHWVHNYDPNKIMHNPEDDKGIQGLNGRVFIGKNTNLLFVPYSLGGIYCCLWSSSLKLNDPNKAYYLGFDSVNVLMRNSYRCDSKSIRPVINL